MDCPDFGVCNPSVIQPNVRRQATLNRDTDSVVVLTPNIKLVTRRSSSLAGFGRKIRRYQPCNSAHCEYNPTNPIRHNRAGPTVSKIYRFAEYAHREEHQTNEHKHRANRHPAYLLGAAESIPRSTCHKHSSSEQTAIKEPIWLPAFDEERPDPCLGQSSEPAPDDA